MINEKILLSIETSCDETAAAVVGESYKVYSSVVASQIAIHAKWGGVVPGIACKQHVTAINGVVSEALNTAGISQKEIEAVAVTAGPGLPGCLAVGISAAKAFALGWEKPLVAVNHLEGHIFSAELDGAKIEFPAVYLLVSGGHCMLIYAAERGKYKLLGTTRDDSVGEAYDKVARELGFQYPGGPVIDRLAAVGKETYSFPRPIIKDGYDFSFSGLKSAVRRQIEKGDIVKEDIAASFVAACMEVLTVKLKKAVKEYGPKSAIIVGGVSKSPVLRALLSDGSLGKTEVVFPSLKYSTDNAAMIGAAGWWRFTNNGASSETVGIMPRLSLSRS
ncbi:MAG: tRNA (adenosine(37)-N6)-threonylcarbamoyltransferase complex transferase subunit TsaD [Oscillospiraceae bacterium]|nr:tRNA (adenosine(37)-N6)-threonylcarbamoyltransferase complex transferase subunit TsaD [Oscillospiraceae bacterium]